jgi:hypothetical protein
MCLSDAPTAERASTPDPATPGGSSAPSSVTNGGCPTRPLPPKSAPTAASSAAPGIWAPITRDRAYDATATLYETHPRAYVALAALEHLIPSDLAILTTRDRKRLGMELRVLLEILKS